MFDGLLSRTSTGIPLWRFLYPWRQSVRCSLRCLRLWGPLAAMAARIHDCGGEERASGTACGQLTQINKTPLPRGHGSVTVVDHQIRVTEPRAQASGNRSKPLPNPVQIQHKTLHRPLSGKLVDMAGHCCVPSISINVHTPCIAVNQPGQLNAVCNPANHFLLRHPQPITRRQNLHHKVGRQTEKFLPLFFCERREAFVRNLRRHRGITPNRPAARTETLEPNTLPRGSRSAHWPN